MHVVCMRAVLQTGSVFSFAAGIVLIPHGRVSSASPFGVGPSVGPQMANWFGVEQYVLAISGHLQTPWGLLSE